MTVPDAVNRDARTYQAAYCQGAECWFSVLAGELIEHASDVSTQGGAYG